ncbi:hypothetical protein ACFSL6_17815 [Paenibacillus thailandensis]|uniref:Uncharacterized protein n=1 Tax=Paenibacillus thailandensis TaxID=393250 RepID=A0ABW5R228_9BACL
MIHLSSKHLQVLQIIEASPGIKYSDIFEQAKASHGQHWVMTAIKTLLDKGLIYREGNKKHYQFYWTDVPYQVSEEVKHCHRMPDLLIQNALSELTDEQKYYIRHHRKRMTRSQLAKKLGISKLALTLYLDNIPNQIIERGK